MAEIHACWCSGLFHIDIAYVEARVEVQEAGRQDEKQDRGSEVGKEDKN